MNEEIAKEEKIVEVDCDELRIIADQIVPPYDSQEILGLSKNIEANGVLTPLIVRRKDGELFVLSGRNRTTAARLAGKKTVPCKIIECTDIEAECIILDSNFLQRHKMPPSALILSYSKRFEVEKQLKAERLKNAKIRKIEDNKVADELADKLGISRALLFKYDNFAKNLDSSVYPLLDAKKINIGCLSILKDFEKDQQKYIINNLEKKTARNLSLLREKYTHIIMGKDVSKEEKEVYLNGIIEELNAAGEIVKCTKNFSLTQEQSQYIKDLIERDKANNHSDIAVETFAIVDNVKFD